MRYMLCFYNSLKQGWRCANICCFCGQHLILQAPSLIARLQWHHDTPSFSAQKRQLWPESVENPVFNTCEKRRCEWFLKAEPVLYIKVRRTSINWCLTLLGDRKSFLSNWAISRKGGLQCWTCHRWEKKFLFNTAKYKNIWQERLEFRRCIF